MTGQSMKGGCGPMHWSCCFAPLLGKVFWIAGIVSLVLAWIAKGDAVWGWSAQTWYLNAAVFGILAIGGKVRKGWCKSSAGGSDGCCGKGMCAGGSCSAECQDCK